MTKPLRALWTWICITSVTLILTSCDGRIDIATPNSDQGSVQSQESTTEWPDSGYDFGEVSVDDGAVQIEHQFRVTNSTARTLRVEKIVTSCGCVKARLDLEALSPGQSTALHTAIEVNGVGSTEQSVRIAFSNGTTAKFWLRAIGTRSTQLHVIPMRQRISGARTIVHVRLQTVDRAGRVETGEPVAQVGDLSLPTTFSGWTVLEAQNDTYQRPLRQTGELEIDLSAYSGTFPVVIRITTASALVANITVDKFD